MAQTSALRRMRGYAGAQIERQIAERLSAIAQAFALDGAPSVGQGGLRWTIDRGRIDLDLLASCHLDPATARAVTLGLTVRR